MYQVIIGLEVVGHGGDNQRGDVERVRRGGGHGDALGEGDLTGAEEALASALSIARELPAPLLEAEELATLFAVETLAHDGDHDLVVVDCAPTDAALRLATLPEVARASMRVALRIQGAIARVATPLASAVVPAPLPTDRVSAEIFARGPALDAGEENVTSIDDLLGGDGDDVAAPVEPTPTATTVPAGDTVPIMVKLPCEPSTVSTTPARS